MYKDPPAELLRRRNPPNTFTYEEYQSLLAVLKLRADRCHPMIRDSLKDMVELLVDVMPTERSSALPFVNNLPGDMWVSTFCGRQLVICFGQASKQKEIRFKHCNADALTDHPDFIHNIIKGKLLP